MGVVCLRIVELHGADKPAAALLNQIVEGCPVGVVMLGDVHDQSEVSHNQGFAGDLVAGLDPGRQLMLLRQRKKAGFFPQYMRPLP
jgi:hypothetical protein